MRSVNPFNHSVQSTHKKHKCYIRLSNKRYDSIVFYIEIYIMRCYTYAAKCLVLEGMHMKIALCAFMISRGRVDLLTNHSQVKKNLDEATVSEGIKDWFRFNDYFNFIVSVLWNRVIFRKQFTLWISFCYLYNPHLFHATKTPAGNVFLHSFGILKYRVLLVQQTCDLPVA